MTIENTAQLPSALASQDAIMDRLRDRPVALFLDFDGTLTPIVDRPEDARLSDDVRRILQRIAARCPVTIVSGRDRSVVEQLIGLGEIGYVGNHGFDIVGARGSGIRHEVGTGSLTILDAAEAALRERLAGIEGASVERKRFSVVAHYRLVAADRRARVEAVVDAVHARHPALRKIGGKAVFELGPAADWDKGRAVLWMLDALGLERPIPIHIGDDLTDEAAFEALADLGVGIVVAEDDRPTSARYVLRNAAEVAVFLARFVVRLDQSAS